MKKTFTWLTCLLTVLAYPLADGLAMEDRWVAVEAVIDGDTVRLRNGSLVRYLGIDAPEIGRRNRKSEPFGDAAWNLNRRLVEGKRIRLQFGNRKNDRFGRRLAHPFDESGLLITQRIVEQGLASCYADSDAASRTHQAKLLSAQRQAMEKKVGIWSKPLQGKGPFIGNRRSLRFHTTICPYGQKTGRSNRILFVSRREAHWQGYSPCRQCIMHRFDHKKRAEAPLRALQPLELLLNSGSGGEGAYSSAAFLMASITFSANWAGTSS